MVVIPKSVNPKRIAENFKATQIQLDAEDIKKIEAIDRGTRVFRVYIMNVMIFIHRLYFCIYVRITLSVQLDFMMKEGVTWQEAWDEEADAKFEF